MSEAHVIDSPIAHGEETINNSNSTSVPDEDRLTKTLSNEEESETQKSEGIEEAKKRETPKNTEKLENDDADSSKAEKSSKPADDSAIEEAPPTSPTIKTLDCNKAGECNLLPVLVERLRSALEQSCSSQSCSSSGEEQSAQPEDSGVDSEEDLRIWARGLCNTMEQQQHERLNDAESPRGLKLDLKFLEDLLLSDIQTALGRLQETLMRVDIGTLTRYSSTLDPTNKLNLLKLISSLLANLKIPEGSIVKPEKSTKSGNSSGKRRRADRHTIGVSSEELARARKWLEDKNVSTTAGVEKINDFDNQQASDNVRERNFANVNNDDNCEIEENSRETRDSQSHDKQYDKCMKDALNQQQSLQNRCSIKDTSRDNIYRKTSDDNVDMFTDKSYKDDNTIINEEFGLSASSLYHQSSNVQAKCNKFMAKKSKIKRANTIDIPNYLKLKAESFANGGISLRRPINIGDKLTPGNNYNNGNVIPSFEPKTENDRKFLALINKNNDTTNLPASANLPFKSFNYRQIATNADKNWNSRFSNIKTTFDKPPNTNCQEENNSATRTLNESRKKMANCEREAVVVGSLKIPFKERTSGFSHAPTSPFKKIDKHTKDDTTPGFLKSGYLPQKGSMLRAKVKMFDQENSLPISTTLSPSRTNHQPRNGKRSSNLFANFDANNEDFSEKPRITDNGHLNYHSFCKQFAPFATKNPVDNQKTTPWSNGVSSYATKFPIEKRSRQTLDQRDDDSISTLKNNSKNGGKVSLPLETSDFHDGDSEAKEKSRNRKFYENYEDLGTKSETANSRDIIAYPIEINYEKRPMFDGKYERARKTGNIEDHQQERHLLPSSNIPCLQFIKTVIPSQIQNPSSPPPPPRATSSSVQSVAVQTQREIEPITDAIYRNENRTNLLSRDETRIAKKIVPSPSENFLEDEAQKRMNYDDARINIPRQCNEIPYQQPSSQRDTDLPQFSALRANYPAQGRHQPLPQSAASHVSHPTNYPPSLNYSKKYYPSLDKSYCPDDFVESKASLPPEVPVRANPPKKGIPSILKNAREADDNYEKYGKYEDKKMHDLENYPDYNDIMFHRDNENPIYLPPICNYDRDKYDDSSIERSSAAASSVISHNPNDSFRPDEGTSYGDGSFDLSEDRSFIDDDNIQNQDISSTEGVITRYACAIATVSPVPETPESSLSSSRQDETIDKKSLELSSENLRSQQAQERQLSYSMSPFYRDERQDDRDKEDSSLDQARRHNLLQQNLIKKLQNDRSVGGNLGGRLSQEMPYRRETINYSLKPEVEKSMPIIARRMSGETSHRDDSTLNDLNCQEKLSEDERTSRKDEIVIENNNTQEKINIFEERNNSLKKHQRESVKPLINVKRDKDPLSMPKINIVSPSKVLKPSFKGDCDSRLQNFAGFKLPPSKNLNSVDSSDEYLMSCANKPSRSIVLSKSESWHQLALSKNTLQVPQAQPCALLKPPKPKSPSSLRLSKQYEASSSSDNVKKMEEKVQRYFQGSSSSLGQQSDSPLASRRDSKNKRQLNSSGKCQGALTRSQTMPHIYDDTTDVEKAFDSLFKEATRPDNRY